MAESHVISSIDPGLSLVLFEAEFPNAVRLERLQPACLAFTILLDGSISFEKPFQGIALSDSILMSVSAESFPVVSTIAKCDQLRSVGLHIELDWLEQSAAVLKEGPETEKLRHVARTEQKFQILKQTDGMRALASKLLEKDVPRENSTLTHLQQRSAAYEMLYELAKVLVLQDEMPKVDENFDLVSKIYQQIEASPEGYDTVNDLALEFGISGRVLSQSFQKRFGLSPAKAIRKARLERAHRLIEFGKPVSVAGFEAGYKNASSFSSAFFNYFGYAPKEVKFSASTE